MSIAVSSRQAGIAVLIGIVCVLSSGCTILVPQVQPKPLPDTDPFRQNCAASTSSEMTKGATKATSKPSTTTAAAELEALKKAKEESLARAMNSSGGIDPQLVGLSLCEGYVRAEEYRRDYYRAVRWDSGLHTTLNVVTIALAGLVAREGFNPNPSNAKMADFIVGTVILYGWSTVLTSSPREKVYLNGVQAMSCAMVEAQPIMVGVMQLQPLEAQVAKVKAARATFDQALDAAGLTPLINPGDDKYLKLQSDSDNAIARISSYSQQLAQASGQLLPLIEILAAQVGRNIVDTEPSNESIQTLIGAFGTQTRGLMTASLPPASPTTPPKTQSGEPARLVAETNVAPSYKALRAQVEALNGLMAKIADISDSKTRIAACKAESVANEFKVDPDVATAVIKVGETSEFKVTNKVAVPTASIDGDTSGSVEKLDTLVREQVFVVRIKGVKAAETGPVLTITDGTGQQTKRITLHVAAADSNTPPKPAQTPPQTPAPAPAAKIQDDERTRLANAAFVDEVANEKPEDFLRRSIRALQCVLKAEVDGKVGTDTRTKITDYMKGVTGRDKSDAIDDALVKRVGDELGAGAAACRKQT